MNMAEALEWAADYAQRAKIFEPIRNDRGYADGWKPPTPAEKAAIITDLARSAASSTDIHEIVVRCTEHGAIVPTVRKV